jgi:uncharacterized protein YifE (UPF0438 family)
MAVFAVINIMPVPSQKKEEDDKEFVSRCMGDDTMVKDFKDIKQRYAICIRQTKEGAKAEVEELKSSIDFLV